MNKDRKAKRGFFLILNGKAVTAVVCIILAAAIFGIVYSPAIVGAYATERQLPIYCVETDEKKIAISFDAAWGNEDTEELIRILDEYDVKTTFFVVGEWVDKYPESVKALSDAGHEIMNHSDDHAHFAQLSASEIVSNITACNDKIAAITGIKPILFRPPYGEYDDHVIAAVESMGMYSIQWDVDSLDWKELSAGEITKRVTENVTPGSIVLFHNAAINTPEALPGILSDLQSKGYEIVPISELIIRENYEIDHTGRQYSK